ncbi:hypothetical protein ACXZ9C_10580 [Streptococcus agalactiae]
MGVASSSGARRPSWRRRIVGERAWWRGVRGLALVVRRVALWRRRSYVVVSFVASRGVGR